MRAETRWMARVLVVEDEPEVRRACAEIVRDLGYTPLVATDGVEAVRAFDRYHPDAVVLDLRLPGMNGYEVLDHIRTSQPPGPPVIVVSGDATGSWSLKRGASAFLRKPFDLGTLSRTVKAQVEAHA